MDLLRRGAGEACLMQEGREVLTLLAASSSDDEFAALIRRVELALLEQQRPQVVVVHQEGLLSEVHADIPLDMVFIEHDPHDLPAVRIRHHRPGADPSAVAAALAQAERRASGAR